ncbi:hypothetical protein VNI00_013310 [Paramarasmius palmivorus]|uniref:Uncharacterized protein n=1 Tax=Paramarasmius palmivorus TaxID=297713 RepID=A0AAW0C3C5_9AGAR
MTPVFTSHSIRTTSSFPSNAVAESALTSTGLSASVVVILFVFTALYFLIPLFFNWLYPYQSIDTLQEMVKATEVLIKENNCVRSGQNALRSTADGYKMRLRAFHALVNNLQIKSRDEPNRLNVVSYTRFWYTLRKEVSECWLGLRKLEGEIKQTIERVAERGTLV